MKKKNIKKYNFCIVVIICIGGFIMGNYFWNNGKNKDVISYEDKLLNIEFSNYVEDAKGEVNRHWNKEDYAYVCFKMRGTTEQTVGLIEKRCGKPIDISNYTVPAYQNNAIAKEMNDKSIKEVFYVFVEGKKAKTRSIDIYVTEDKDGMVYVYIFG